MATAAATPAQAQLPEGVAALAAAQGLGQHWETFLPKRAGGWRIAGMIFFALLGLLALVLPGLMFVWLLMQTPNFSRKQAAKRIHLFENGLIVGDHTGPVSAFRWDSMSALQQITKRYANGVYVGTSYLYTLFQPDGSTVKLTNFYTDPERWGMAIQHEVTKAQLPMVLATLERGETVRFGDTAMTIGGIATTKRGAVQWSEIQKIEVQNGVVFLSKAGKRLAWSNTPVAKIPNFFLFLTVVDHLRQNHRSSSN